MQRHPCTLEAITTRGNGGWLGDVLVEARANYYGFGDTDLIRRFLRLHALGQRPDGSFCSKYPARRDTNVHTWSLTYPMTLEDYFTFSGDEATLRELLPSCRGVIDWLETHRTAEGLYGNFELTVTSHENTYVFIDWAPLDPRGCNAALNAFAYAALNSCATMGNIVGQEDFARLSQQRADELRAAFTRHFWDDRRGVFVNGLIDGKPTGRWGCQENYLALVFGLADDSQRQQIVDALRREDLLSTFVADASCHDEFVSTIAIALGTYRWPDDRMVPLGTPYFGYWALSALFEGGMEHEALAMIRKHWGNFLRQGATTVWEVWDHQGSHSHAWSGGPMIVLGQYILGVRRVPAEPDTVEILPVRADLTGANGRVPTRRGEVQVEWEYDGQWTLDVVIPTGLTARVGLPGRDVETLLLNGTILGCPDRLNRKSLEFLVVELSAGRHQIQGLPYRSD